MIPQSSLCPSIIPKSASTMVVPYLGFCLALLLATSTHLDHNTFSPDSVVFRSVPQTTEPTAKTSSKGKNAIDEFMSDFFKDINPDFEVQPASTEPPIGDDDERPSRGWCKNLLEELDDWYAKVTLIDLDVALAELELCIEYISRLQSTQPDDASLAQMQTKLLNYREIVRPYVLSGQIDAQPTYPLVSLSLQSQEPSRDWCQTVVDELHNRYLDTADPNRRIIEQPEVIMAQLQSCIEFISAEQSANPEDASLAQLQSWLLYFLEHVRQFLQPQPDEQQAAVTPKGRWLQPSPELRKWLELPVDQITHEDDTKLATSCSELITFLEANFPPKKQGPKMEDEWNIPLISFSERLKQCSEFFQSRGNLQSQEILDMVLARTLHRIDVTAHEGNPRWQPPSTPLLAWLRRPVNQIVAEDKIEQQAYCSELIRFVEANFKPERPGPQVEQLWSIPLESFRKRLNQCASYYKEIGGLNLDGKLALENAKRRTVDRLRKEKAPVEPSIHSNKKQKMSWPTPPDALLTWLRSASVPANAEIFCPQLYNWLAGQGNIGGLQFTGALDKYNIGMENFKRRLATCKTFFNDYDSTKYQQFKRWMDRF